MSPLRDALRQLESGGLVQLRSKKGVRVTNIDPTFIRNAYQIRRFLEVQACMELKRVGPCPELADIAEELIRIWEQSNVTVFFVTHSVEEAIFLGDRVVVLSHGPGTIKKSLEIDIPRKDRNWATLNKNPAFHKLKDEITLLVRKDDV